MTPSKFYVDSTLDNFSVVETRKKFRENTKPKAKTHLMVLPH